MPLTESQKREYFEKNGTACPFCDSADIYADAAANVDAGEATQEITCAECGAEWKDVYVLTCILVEKEPEPSTARGGHFEGN